MKYLVLAVVLLHFLLHVAAPLTLAHDLPLLLAVVPFLRRDK